MRGALLLVPLFVTLLAQAGEAVGTAVPAVRFDAPVRRPLAGTGATVNWTEGTVEVVASGADPRVEGDLRPVEQQALRGVEQRIVGLVDRVPLREGLRVGDLPDTLRPSRPGWTVSESRYHTSGKVEVVGAIDLRAVVEGWMSSRAGAPPTEPREGASGLLVDARGLVVDPVYAPAIVGPGGEVLYDGVLDPDRAWERTPVAWVIDPAHPAAARAGDAPVLVRAAQAAEGRLVLSAEDAARVHEGLDGTRTLFEGAVVVVVDP